MAEGKPPRARDRAVASRLLFGHRTGGSRGEQPPADRRRAHQRHRLAPVQEHDRRREVGRSHRDRALAGEERRAHRRRLPAILRSRRDEGHRPVLRQADPQDQSAGDDRHHRSAGGRAGADVCQGKSIINSINLEDGEEKFERVCPIAQALRRGAGRAAPSTKTSSRRRRSRASASWRWRSARCSC